MAQDCSRGTSEASERPKIGSQATKSMQKKVSQLFITFSSRASPDENLMRIIQEGKHALMNIFINISSTFIKQSFINCSSRDNPKTNGNIDENIGSQPKKQNSWVRNQKKQTNRGSLAFGK